MQFDQTSHARSKEQVCLFEVFYGPVNTIKVMLSVVIYSSNWQLHYLNQLQEENGHRNCFLTHRHKRVNKSSVAGQCSSPGSGLANKTKMFFSAKNKWKQNHWTSMERKNCWTRKYRSLWPTFIIRSITATDSLSKSLMFIHEIVLKIWSKIWHWTVTYRSLWPTFIMMSSIPGLGGMRDVASAIISHEQTW